MARTPRIAVVGSVNADLITFGEVFPRPGETVFGKTFRLAFGGKGANQAVAARLCGAEVMMVAKVGDDLFGDACIRNLSSFGIDTSYVRLLQGASTGVAPIFVESTGENRIIVIKGANDLLMPQDVDAAAHSLRAVDTIVLQFEIPLETVYHTVRFACSHGIGCIVNPAPALAVDLAQLASANFIIPNETEAELLTGQPVNTVEGAGACARTLLQHGFPHAVLTLGARGALLADPGGALHAPPLPVQAVDSTGAGDAFIGSLAVFLAEGLTPAEAVARANVYAALSTTRVGAQKSFPRRDEFEAEWQRGRQR